MDGPVDKGRQHQLIAVTVAFVTLGTLITIARVFTRVFIVRSLGKDDWAMVVGWASAVGYMAQIFLLARWGIGLPASENSMEDMVRLMKVSKLAPVSIDDVLKLLNHSDEYKIKITLAVQATYYLAVASIKISIVLFYLRLMEAQTGVRRLCQATIVLLAVFLVICITTTLAQCVPMEKQWDFIGAIPGKCINTTAFFYSTSAFNIITDIWIICLPIGVLSKIHRPQREKIILFVVFGMGVIACVASIVRLYSIRMFTLSEDPFYDGCPVNIWSMVEINVGILCASVPALKPLLSKAHATAQYYGKSSTSSAPYRLGPLSPNESKNPKINTSVRTDHQSFPLSMKRADRTFDKMGSTEAINQPVDSEGIEIHRGFTFREERVGHS